MHYKNKTVNGFITLKIKRPNLASIGLIGVNKNYQGNGYGSIIVKYLFYFLYKRNFKKLYVVTQGRNIKAQRLYQKNGFVIKSSEIWYHKWLN